LLPSHGLLKRKYYREQLQVEVKREKINEKTEYSFVRSQVWTIKNKEI